MYSALGQGEFLIGSLEASSLFHADWAYADWARTVLCATAKRCGAWV